jgi:dCTP diphosphatase
MRRNRYCCEVESDHTIELLRRFSNERDWNQFHSAENLAKSICIESAELLECFQWSETASSDRVADELADVLTYCFLLADSLGANPDDLIRRKLEITRMKYPVDESRGRSAKYDQL